MASSGSLPGEKTSDARIHDTFNATAQSNALESGQSAVAAAGSPTGCLQPSPFLVAWEQVRAWPPRCGV
eukprot:353575-Chlamydomonas_euryale.AAC.2